LPACRTRLKRRIGFMLNVAFFTLPLYSIQLARWQHVISFVDRVLQRCAAG